MVVVGAALVVVVVVGGDAGSHAVTAPTAQATTAAPIARFLRRRGGRRALGYWSMRSFRPIQVDVAGDRVLPSARYTGARQGFGRPDGYGAAASSAPHDSVTGASDRRKGALARARNQAATLGLRLGAVAASWAMSIRV